MSTPALPLFPLDTVLFPGGPLSLRIFEPRYLDMVRRCLREQTPFGVVRLVQGEEAGAAGEVAGIGTSARPVDFGTLEDGLLGIVCLGEQRFRVGRRWRQQDGLNLAEVEYLPAEEGCELRAECAHFADLLRDVLPKLGRAYAYAPLHYGDAGWVANRLAEILPLSGAEKQALLEVAEPLARLTQVAAWSTRQPASADP
jgi:Lon protease-like protein